MPQNKVTKAPKILSYATTLRKNNFHWSWEMPVHVLRNEVKMGWGKQEMHRISVEWIITAWNTKDKDES